jgi:hypothetical protein
VEITTNKIHYLVIPAYVQFNINDKTTVFTGVNNYFLFTSSNEFTKYTESYGIKTEQSQEVTYGYASGFSNYDVGMVAGVKRYLFFNMSVAAEFNFGLTDIKKNDYYETQQFDRNVSGQISLLYQLK